MTNSEKTEMATHVDDFIDAPSFDSDRERYAKWVLHLFRLPASLKITFQDYISQYKLFGTYKGNKYRITGASRLGDVWLTSNFNQHTGYELRVSVDDISDWSNK